MSIVFPLPELVTRVRNRFVADAVDGTPVPVTFGWREKARQRQTSHRIIFVPGDDSNGNLGPLSAPESPNVGLSRPIATLDEIFTAYVEAEDVSAPDSEEAQYAAARTLFDAWLVAVHGARIRYAITSDRWVTDQTVRYAGAVIRITGTVSAIVRGAPSQTAPSDTTARITVRELNVTTALTIPEVP